MKSEPGSATADAQPAPAVSASYASLRVVALLCIVLPLLLYALVGAYRFQQVREESGLRLDRALRIATEHALKVLDTNEVLLTRVLDATGSDDDAALKAHAPELRRQIAAMAQNKPQIQSISVVDSHGRLVLTDRTFPGDRKPDLSDREYFRWHAQKRGGLYVSRPLVGRASQDKIIHMSRGRYLPDGSFGGIVAISLFPSYFEKFHNDLVADEPGLAVTMLREDGSILSRWPPLPDARAVVPPDSPLMQAIRGGQRQGRTAGISSEDQHPRVLQFSKLGDYPIYIGTGMDVSDMTRRWRVEMAWLAAFGLPSLLGLLFALRIAMRRTRDALQSAQRLGTETLALRRVEEALLQAQKMEALGRLTGGVAHDFNNALMVISNNLYILKLRQAEPGNQQLDSIARAVASATKLTRQLLAFSRRQPLVPETFSPHERLPSTRDLLGPVLGSQIELSIEVAPDTRPIKVDPAEFELALINLAINARDAMPSGGSFRIQARNATELPALLQAPMVVVEVRDTGMGIAQENLDKVFDPFFTTKPVGEGTGLGLSQVYGLCQRAGGTATIDSQSGQGTTVRLFFPPSPEAANLPPAHLAPQRHDFGKSVLLVEDNDEVAIALVPVLESLGCKVTRLDRAVAARSWLAGQLVLPDLLLTDVIMPGEIDGVALAQHAREHYPRMHVMLMTGFTDQLDAIAQLGFEVLPKPCAPETLAQALARIFARAHA